METEPLRWEWIAKLPTFARNLLHKGQGRNFQFAQMECNTMRAKWQVADKAAGTDFHRCHVCTWFAPSGSPGSASQMTRMDICCWRFLSWLSCWRFAIPSSWWATLEVPWRKTCHESQWMNAIPMSFFYVISVIQLGMGPCFPRARLQVILVEGAEECQDQEGWQNHRGGLQPQSHHYQWAASWLHRRLSRWNPITTLLFRGMLGWFCKAGHRKLFERNQN